MCIIVASMHIDTTISRRGDKVYTRHLLRTSFREDGKVKHKTIANLSSCSEAEITAMKLALKHKASLGSLVSISDLNATLGKSFGAVYVLNALAERLGIAKALGSDLQAKLALFQVIARIAEQGSRLSAVRFAMRHAACELLGIPKLTEDFLYENLAWIAENQEEIEKRLFKIRFPKNAPTLFLYDVTSSYLEGDCNALAKFGYNRDKKSGKKQIVVGLLTGPDGLPVAIRVFEGNTNDTKTVAEQVRTLSTNFGVKNITLVGDRGMLKGPQINALPDDFRYITAITKPAIQKMLSEGTFQYELFSDHVCEIEKDNVRYILRRNPIRAEQTAASRKSKHASLEKFANNVTAYLDAHPKADADKAKKKVIAKIAALKADKWLVATEKNRQISIEEDPDALSQASLLDGCYVIKTDVRKEDADTKDVHDRYCDLENVERDFRSLKTGHLELRPVYVVKETSTKGHVFVAMLALILQRELERCWKDIDVTVEEGIADLSSIHLMEFNLGNTTIQDIPKPAKPCRRLLEKTGITLPSILPKTSADVYTKKKLPSERISI